MGDLASVNVRATELNNNGTIYGVDVACRIKNKIEEYSFDIKFENKDILENIIQLDKTLSVQYHYNVYNKDNAKDKDEVAKIITELLTGKLVILYNAVVEILLIKDLILNQQCLQRKIYIVSLLDQNELYKPLTQVLYKNGITDYKKLHPATRLIKLYEKKLDLFDRELKQ